MADIRDAFADHVLLNWQPVAFGKHWDPTALIPLPSYVWPDTSIRLLIACWKAFRRFVLKNGKNGGRENLVPVAKWLAGVLRSLRDDDTHLSVFALYPWTRDFGAAVCETRIKWIMRYPGAATYRDMAWARAVRPDIFGSMMARQKKELGVRSGIARVSHTCDGKALEKPVKRLAWVAWPADADSPSMQAEAQRLVGREHAPA